MRTGAWGCKIGECSAAHFATRKGEAEKGMRKEGACSSQGCSNWITFPIYCSLRRSDTFDYQYHIAFENDTKAPAPSPSLASFPYSGAAGDPGSATRAPRWFWRWKLGFLRLLSFQLKSESLSKIFLASSLVRRAHNRMQLPLLLRCKVYW